ncbi:MAG: hypothetical protein WAX44_00715 [Minisyncoccia bacterium]
MNNEQIRNIEELKPDQIQSELEGPMESEESILGAFSSAIKHLIYEPNLYYLYVSEDSLSATVKKKANDESVYDTTVSAEIDTLREAGIVKKDEIK